MCVNKHRGSALENLLGSNMKSFCLPSYSRTYVMALKVYA